MPQARIETNLAHGEARRSFTRSFKDGMRSFILRLPTRKSRTSNSGSSMVVSPRTGRLGRARRASFRVDRPTSDGAAFEYVPSLRALALALALRSGCPAAMTGVHAAASGAPDSHEPHTHTHTH